MLFLTFACLRYVVPVDQVERGFRGSVLSSSRPTISPPPNNLSSNSKPATVPVLNNVVTTSTSSTISTSSTADTSETAAPRLSPILPTELPVERQQPNVDRTHKSSVITSNVASTVDPTTKTAEQLEWEAVMAVADAADREEQQHREAMRKQQEDDAKTTALIKQLAKQESAKQRFDDYDAAQVEEFAASENEACESSYSEDSHPRKKRKTKARSTKVTTPRQAKCRQSSAVSNNKNIPILPSMNPQ